jgi:hypothetical protein
VLYNAAPRQESMFCDSGRGRRKPMKQAIRISVLMCALVGTYVSAAVPQVPAPDGGPIALCPPNSTKCIQLPPMMK